MPRQVVRREGFAIKKLDKDKPSIKANGNYEIQIVGQTVAYAFIEGEDKPRFFRALVVSGANEILISWQLLMKWGCIPKHFPYPSPMNGTFKIDQGRTLDDVILDEGKGKFKTGQIFKRR